MAYLASCSLFAPLFAGVYFACNALTERRAHALSLFLPGELAIPFVPGFVWIYASLFLLWPLQALVLPPRAIRRLTVRLLVGTLIGGLCFLVFPARLGFYRVLPEGATAAVFRGLFALDRAHNLVPSLHVLNGSLVLLAFLDHAERPWARAGWLLWLVLIAASTLLVHQHHLLDVATGLGLALLLHRAVLPDSLGKA